MTEITGELDEIQGLSASSRELLEAAGVENLLALADSEAGPLEHELQGANAMLGLADQAPSSAEIESWIARAREILDYHPEPEIPRLQPVDEPTREREVLMAIQVPVKHMVKHKVSVGQIPAMESFVEDGGDEDEAAHDQVVEAPPAELPPAPEPRSQAAAQVVRIEAKSSRFELADKEESDEKRESPKIEPLPSITDIRKAPSAGLNAGKTPHSRGYIRGVLHPQPVRVRIGAILSIFTLTLFFGTFVACGLILLGNSMWLLAIPAAFVVFALFYLMFARGMKCRICGQPLFSPKACRKHVKAHHIPLIGYILPTSFHVLLFSWFRCIYCGTSVRVKE